MTKRPILTALFASIVFCTALTASFFSNEHVQVSVFNKQLEALQGIALQGVFRINPEAYGSDPVSIKLDETLRLGKYGEWTFCEYTAPEAPTYAVELLSVEQSQIQPGEAFQVDMTFVNTGNARLFSRASNCFEQAQFNVGTARNQDRLSLFGNFANAISGWSEGTRIIMADPFADPNQEFHVTFESLAPLGDNIYREFFQPVVEGHAWIGEPFTVDFEVGEPTEQMRSDIQFVVDAAMDAASLTGLERNLEINLATQTMYAKFGDISVWSMDVSSGKAATPTPRGHYKIFQKQELRVGAGWPHYHMPHWQFWDARGYGIHGLPYLANDNGAFWYEAVSHLGTPVSHGCVRTLDRDAETLYKFTSIGTPLWIH